MLFVRLNEALKQEGNGEISVERERRTEEEEMRKNLDYPIRVT